MIGRLWRRAPAWRLCLFAAVGFTALAAMFPPKPPDRPVSIATAAAARYVPPSGDRALSSFGALEAPPAGASRSGVVAFAGRQLPLPAGIWQELVFGRGEGASPKQVVLLARVHDRRLTGLVLALAPDALSPATGLLQTPEACRAADIVAGEMAPATAGQSPFVHECWTLSPADVKADVTAQSGLLHRGLVQLGQQGVAIPDHMLAMRYVRSTETGWSLAMIFLPERADASLAANRKLAAWAKRFAGLLHRGYDGAIGADKSVALLARDPG